MSLPSWPPFEASSTEGETCAVEEVARGELGMPALERWIWVWILVWMGEPTSAVLALI